MRDPQRDHLAHRPQIGVSRVPSPPFERRRRSARKRDGQAEVIALLQDIREVLSGDSQRVYGYGGESSTPGPTATSDEAPQRSPSIEEHDDEDSGKQVKQITDAPKAKKGKP